MKVPDAAGVADKLEELLFQARFLPTRRVVPAYLKLASFLGKRAFTDLPFGAYFALTYRCDARCRHCFVSDYGLGSGPELSFEELRAFLDFLHGWGPFAVFFSGGEPMLREDIGELTEHAAGRGFIVSLETNGSRLTRNAVQDLKNAGISNIRVSIDSADAETHDAHRCRPGSYRAAVAGLEQCVSQGVRCLLVCCASSSAVRTGELERIVDLARQLGVDGVKILNPKILGRWKDAEGVRLTDEDEARVASLMDPSFVYPEQIRGTDCYTRGRKYFCLNPQGEVLPCPSVPVTFGNIREGDPAAILARLLGHRFEEGAECDGCVSASPGFRERMLFARGRQLPVSVEEYERGCPATPGGKGCG